MAVQGPLLSTAWKGLLQWTVGPAHAFCTGTCLHLTAPVLAADPAEARGHWLLLALPPGCQVRQPHRGTGMQVAWGRTQRAGRCRGGKVLQDQRLGQAQICPRCVHSCPQFEVSTIGMKGKNTEWTTAEGVYLPLPKKEGGEAENEEL